VVKIILETLDSWGFNGGSITLIILLLLGYVKIITNHYKHILRSISNIDKRLDDIDKRTVRLETFHE